MLRTDKDENLDILYGEPKKLSPLKILGLANCEIQMKISMRQFDQSPGCWSLSISGIKHNRTKNTGDAWLQKTWNVFMITISKNENQNLCYWLKDRNWSSLKVKHIEDDPNLDSSLDVWKFCIGLIAWNQSRWIVIIAWLNQLESKKGRFCELYANYQPGSRGFETEY